MISRLRTFTQGYPRQFWFLFWGMLISTSGTSMIWPFLTIFLRQRLGLPIATIGTMLAINSIMGLASSSIAGPITDRLGRKGVMVLSLCTSAFSYLTISHSSSLPVIAALLALNGAANPLYRIGADAMVADIIPPEHRVEAYSILRMINNAGVAIGPSIGGFIAVTSYTNTFIGGAVALTVYALLISFFTRETLPQRAKDESAPREKMGGYETVLKDVPFLLFCANFTLTALGSTLIFQLLSVYTKENFGIPESQYGFIMATNAIMVVLFQYMVTGVTKRYPPFRVLSIGAFFYAIGIGSIALMHTFWGFLVSMVIATTGELITVPTATTLTARLAPADMRGRYMSVYWLASGAGSGVGSIIGGLLNDLIAPQAIWVGGMVFGLISAIGFLEQARHYRRTAAQQR
jgi:MFS family permease